ncbi:kinase-like protein [Decorospora gaudefroyi]|uniref:Kinase-like protein n=1 Tax=Decorospora gaudefroyi TaxID=184978 RepID=A0A6A5KQ54_9PLEO|nr:kinase-like protein [Decorospora gaudefroyi]
MAVTASSDVPGPAERSKALEINNTYLRRFLARIALHTTAKFFKHNGPCIPISKHQILKTGYSVHLMEAATMIYVAQNTSIPVPKVYSSFIHKNRAYIIMERIRGKDLASAWKSLSKESLQKILSQLKDIIQELRSIEPPPQTGVESCVGGSLYDSRLPHGTPRLGPFKTPREFHRWLRNDAEASQLRDSITKQEADDIKAMVAQQDGEWPNPVFTHCDLNPSNILIRGQEIVGIIDWEFAGWYPPYWEYTSAWRGNIIRREWQDILLSLLDPFPEELDMERTRCKWWGEWRN